MHTWIIGALLLFGVGVAEAATVTVQLSDGSFYTFRSTSNTTTTPTDSGENTFNLTYRSQQYYLDQGLAEAFAAQIPSVPTTPVVVFDGPTSFITTIRTDQAPFLGTITAPTPVPEPATWMLALVGTLGILLAPWRNRWRVKKDPATQEAG